MLATHRRFRFFMLSLLALTFSAVAQDVFTPKAGSAERKAVCDALRTFFTDETMPKHLVFRVDTMRIQGDYCFFQGLPMFEDGSAAVARYLPDVGYDICLMRGKKGWKVVVDLSRSDVPSDREVREIKRDFPRDFPVSLLSEFWRDLFKKVR